MNVTKIDHRRSRRAYVPLDEGGEVVHMAAARHDRQHVAPRDGKQVRLFDQRVSIEV